MTDVLELDTYVIARHQGFSLNVPYDVYDNQGNKLLEVKHGMIGEVYSLLDSSGKTFGIISRKMIALTPSYDLQDANKTDIGKVVEEINIAGGLLNNTKNFALQDAAGNKIAQVKLTGPLAILTEMLKGEAPSAGNDITTPDGSKVIGKLATQMGNLTYLNQRPAFVLQVTDNSISKLALLEFAIAVDHLYSSAQYMSNNRPAAGGFGGNRPPGSGSGFTFKL